MKAGTLNLPDLDFKMKGFWKFVNPDTIFFYPDWGFKKNLETEYLKYLDHLKCKVTKKNSNAIKTQKKQHTSPPPPQIGHGWGKGYRYIRGWRG